jgi:Putative abortive phage resistance protein AbiGi, antitoxin
MSVSANSVIHYTQTLENLKGILTSGFKLKYCSEEVNLNEEGKGVKCGIAMVSFCDIPLSEITGHVGSYGYYGVGLSKNWAKKNKLNPVVYIQKGSSLGVSLLDQSDLLIKGKVKEVQDIIPHFWQIIGYLKNYDGDLIRGDQKLLNYKFYNEREWRYVPNKEDLNGNNFYCVDKEFYEDKEAYNKRLENIFLKFSASDISYLLVKKEEEIIELVKHLRTVYSESCSAVQLEILMTRIMAVENIISDF